MPSACDRSLLSLKFKEKCMNPRTQPAQAPCPTPSQYRRLAESQLKKKVRTWRPKERRCAGRCLLCTWSIFRSISRSRLVRALSLVWRGAATVCARPLTVPSRSRHPQGALGGRRWTGVWVCSGAIATLSYFPYGLSNRGRAAPSHT